jgi:hypothetical protein
MRAGDAALLAEARRVRKRSRRPPRIAVAVILIGMLAAVIVRILRAVPHPVQEHFSR